MRISATGRKSRRCRPFADRVLRPAGFTLIEMLVVLVIVAVAAGMLVLSYGSSPARQLEAETSLLATRLNFALEEATARGRELGLVMEKQGYRFLIFDYGDGVWQPFAERPLVRHRFELPMTSELGPGDTALPEAVRVRIERARGDGEAELRPQVIFFASGETTPFRLTLETEGGLRGEILSDGFNGVSWSLPDA